MRIMSAPIFDDVSVSAATGTDRTCQKVEVVVINGNVVSVFFFKIMTTSSDAPLRMRF